MDSESFDITLRDGATSVTGRVFVDERGAVVNFSTTDRFIKDQNQAWVRTRWTTPIEGWQVVDEHPIPTRGRAVWHLEDGAFTSAELVPMVGTLEFNLKPGA